MPIRNPFARRPGLGPSQDENLHPVRFNRHPGFERVDTVGSKASSVPSLNSARSHDTGEYKMSVVNDSGVYLPPSPTETTAPWSRRFLTSRTSTGTPSSPGEIEPFSISRESFDSYRRSFDVSARSPVAARSTRSRQSLDSARLPSASPRLAVNRGLERRPSPMAEDGFEEVRLDDAKQQQQQQQQQPAARAQQQQQHQQPHALRKRGFFAKLADAQDKDAASAPIVPRFLMPGRKRGQAATATAAAELYSMERPEAAVEGESRG